MEVHFRVPWRGVFYNQNKCECYVMYQVYIKHRRKSLASLSFTYLSSDESNHKISKIVLTFRQLPQPSNELLILSENL